MIIGRSSRPPDKLNRPGRGIYTSLGQCDKTPLLRACGDDGHRIEVIAFSFELGYGDIDSFGAVCLVLAL